MFAECCIEIVVWNLRVDHDDHDYFLTSNVDIYSFFQGLIPGMKYSYRVQSGSNISDGFEFTAKRDDEVRCYISLEPLALKISLVILLTECHLILMMLRLRIWYSINL